MIQGAGTFDEFLARYQDPAILYKPLDWNQGLYVNEQGNVCIEEFIEINNFCRFNQIKEISELLFREKPQYIMRIIDIYDQERYCHAMECGLTDLRQQKDIKTFEKIAIMHQIALAVKEVHELNILHNNLNLSSFVKFSTYNRIQYKLTGFSKAQFVMSIEEIDSNSEKNYYQFAPEQLYIQNQTIDLWALGNIFYIILFQEPFLKSKTNHLAIHELETLRLDEIHQLIMSVSDQFISEAILGLLHQNPQSRMPLNIVLRNIENAITNLNYGCYIQYQLLPLQKSKDQYKICYSLYETKYNVENSDNICYLYNKSQNRTLPNRQFQINEIQLNSLNNLNHLEQLEIFKFMTLLMQSKLKVVQFDHVLRYCAEFSQLDNFPKMECTLRRQIDRDIYNIELQIISCERIKYQVMSEFGDFDDIVYCRQQLYESSLSKCTGFNNIFVRYLQKKPKLFTYCLNFLQPIPQIPGFIQVKAMIKNTCDIQYFFQQDIILEHINYMEITDFLQVTYILLFTSRQLIEYNRSFLSLSDNVIKYRTKDLQYPTFECLPINVCYLEHNMNFDQISNNVFQYVVNQLQSIKVQEFLIQNQCQTLINIYEKGLNGRFQFDTDMKEFKFQLQQRQLLSNQLDSLVFVQKIISIDSLLAKQSKSVNCFLQNDIIGRIQQCQPFQSMKLLYRASRDRLIYETFSEQCFNKGRFMMLIQTIYGEIIGGYTPLELMNENRRQLDEQSQTFIFSLTKNEIYPLKRNCDQAIISCYHEWNSFYYFHFGDFDIFLTIPKQEIEVTNPVNLKSNFPRHFQTEQYPHIPELNDEDNTEQYLIGGINDSVQFRGKSKVLELEIFGFEDL